MKKQKEKLSIKLSGVYSYYCTECKVWHHSDYNTERFENHFRYYDTIKGIKKQDTRYFYYRLSNMFKKIKEGEVVRDNDTLTEYEVTIKDKKAMGVILTNINTRLQQSSAYYDIFKMNFSKRINKETYENK